MCTFDLSSCPDPVVFISDELNDDFELDFDSDVEFQDFEMPGPQSQAMDVESDQESNVSLNDVPLENEENENELGDELGDSDDDEMEDACQSIPPVVHHIERIVVSFLTQLAFPGRSKQENESDADCNSSESENETPEQKRKKYSVEIELVDRRKKEVDGVPGTKSLRFPKRTKHGSALPFAQLFRILDIAHEASLNGISVTKRDIYYQDVQLFKSQKVVDKLVDDLAATFQLERSDLNIRSASKGLVCGSGLTITLISGDIIECNDMEGTLIPAGEDIETFGVNEDIAWILVVEKEAVFQTLCRLQISNHESMPGPGILITGKGYPDVATRHLVKSLADALPRSIPVLGMVDGDPFGLDILSVYKYGSQGMQHEKEKLATKRIKWLGLWASELDGLGIPKDQLLPMSRHDEKKAMAILKRTNAPLPRSWKKELQHMIHSRRKAEIEILTSGQHERTDFVGEAQRSSHELLQEYLVSKISEFVEREREKVLIE